CGRGSPPPGFRVPSDRTRKVCAALESGSRLRRPGQRKVKDRSASRRGLHPDPAGMLFENALAGGQPDAVPRIFALVGVQSRENLEDLFVVLGGNADAV